MATVIQRHGHTMIDKDGYIHYDDRPATYEQAEKIAGQRLDRRKNYAIIDGRVAELVSWSRACTGCYEGHDSYSATGNGCSECGYTGRRRQASWVPMLTSNASSTNQPTEKTP